MLSSINATRAADKNKLSSDIIKKAYERRVREKKLKNFKLLHETQYLREPGDSLRMIHFDYALLNKMMIKFIKKSSIWAWEIVFLSLISLRRPRVLTSYGRSCASKIGTKFPIRFGLEKVHSEGSIHRE